MMIHLLLPFGKQINNIVFFFNQITIVIILLLIIFLTLQIKYKQRFIVEIKYI